jgi:transcriptional regulator with XRE-family HTH domain
MGDKEWAAMRGAYWAGVIGANVRAAREAAGLSQAQLGERAGMVVPVISRLESGTHLPGLTTFLKVAEALGVEPAALIRPAKGKGKRKG